MTSSTVWALFLDAPWAYADALALQQELHQHRLADRIPDVVLFLEHTPVVTLGRRGRSNYLLVPPDELRQQGIDFHVASRGGDVTYHGPGQLVMYPIIKLGTGQADAHGYLHNLESIAIRTAASFGVSAFRREGMSGAWTESGKLAAIGFQIKRWVTLHGLSFNVLPDLQGFRYIVGCGLEGEPIASLQQLPGLADVDVAQVRDAMCRAFSEVMERDLQIRPVTGQPGPKQVLEALLSGRSECE